MQLSPEDHWALEHRRAGYLCERFLGTDLTASQADIAGAIAFPDGPSRVAIKAVTQYGKSHAVAAGLGLGFILDSSLRIAVIAPRERQGRVLRDHFAERIIHSPDLQRLLEAPHEGKEKLRREATKKRLTFTGGGELEVFSAEGSGERLMAHGGYDLVIEDEAGLITDAVERVRISRMASKQGARRVKIGNPWAKGSHFHRACESWPTVFHVGWQTAVAEERLSIEFIEEQRDKLSPLEWQVLYEAEFPDTAEDQLIHHEWLTAAVVDGPYEPDEEAKPIAGLDPAEGGRDMCAHVQGWLPPKGETVVLDRWDAWHEPDTMVTIGRVQRNQRGDGIAIDANGLGKPIADRLKQRGLHVSYIKSGRSASNKDRFTNLGSEILWNLRILLEEGRLKLVDPPPRVLSDLSLYRIEHKSGRMHMTVAGGKENYSPDLGDATAYCAWQARRAAAPRQPKPIPRPRSL